MYPKVSSVYGNARNLKPFRKIVDEKPISTLGAADHEASTILETSDFPAC
jgi:hypothetical protein